MMEIEDDIPDEQVLEEFFPDLFDSTQSHIVEEAEYNSLMKDLANAILKSLGKLNHKDRLLREFLGSREWQWRVLTDNYPRYMTAQGFYALSKFFQQKHIIVKHSGSFTGEGSITSPWYKDIEISPSKFSNLMQEGWVFFYYNDIPVVFDMYEDNGVYYTFRAKEDNEGTLKKIMEEVRSIFKDTNLYRGKAIKLTAREEFSFITDVVKTEWEDIIVEDKIRTEIERQLIKPINDVDYHKKTKLPWRRGILLEGPPGTGKTLIGKLLVNKVNATFMYASAKALSNPYDIKIVFEAAKTFAPTVIFFEDIDLFAYSREKREEHNMLGELLSQMDGVPDNEGVFVVATTNRRKTLDQALVNRPNRFDLILSFDVPKLLERMKILHLYNKKFEAGATDGMLSNVANQADKLTPAWLAELIINAKMLALSDKKQTVDEKHLTESLKYIKSLTGLDKGVYA